MQKWCKPRNTFSVPWPGCLLGSWSQVTVLGISDLVWYPWKDRSLTDSKEWWRTINQSKDNMALKTFYWHSENVGRTEGQPSRVSPDETVKSNVITIALNGSHNMDKQAQPEVSYTWGRLGN